jgi:hypothetical protein
MRAVGTMTTKRVLLAMLPIWSSSRDDLALLDA